MTSTVGSALALVMAALSVVHIVWAFRGVSGSSAVIPSRGGVPVIQPGPVSTLAVAMGLAIAAYVALAAAGISPWPVQAIPARTVSLALALLFAARATGEFRYVGFFKKVRGTRFARWDTRLFSPLCAVAGAGFAFLWLGAP